MTCAKDASELAAPHARAARRSRWTGAAFLVAAFLFAVSLGKSGLVYSQTASNDVAAVQKITGHLTSFLVQLLVILALWKAGTSRLGAARHADARARSIRHLESLLASALDDAERRDLRARLADVAAPRSGCCK
ncbi:MAG: hypothetical protein RJA37_259 [Verrucomicrobiota bacterium]|jgi:hypothetical protein